MKELTGVTTVIWLLYALIYEARVPDAEFLAVDGGEHVTIFTHRNMVRAEVNAFMQYRFRIKYSYREELTWVIKEKRIKARSRRKKKPSPA